MHFPLPYSGLAMKNIQITCAFIILALGSLPLRAADPVTVDWRQVCQTAGDYELIVTTSAGDTVQGYCMGVTVTELSVQTRDHRIVKVARNTLSQLVMYRRRGHQLRSLGHAMRGGFHEGFRELFTTGAVVGLVMIPGTLAWGAISAPFCAIGDLANITYYAREIKIRQ